MNEWITEWVSDWVSEWMREWVNEWMSEWMNQCLSEWANESMSEWANEWMSEWVTEWISEWVNQWSDWVSEVTEWMRFVLWRRWMEQWSERHEWGEWREGCDFFILPPRACRELNSFILPPRASPKLKSFILPPRASRILQIFYTPSAGLPDVATKSASDISKSAKSIVHSRFSLLYTLLRPGKKFSASNDLTSFYDFYRSNSETGEKLQKLAKT